MYEQEFLDADEFREEDEMIVLAKKSFRISVGNQNRFPTSQFSRFISFTQNLNPFTLEDFQIVVQRSIRLETYCDAVDEHFDIISEPAGPNEHDLFNAFFFPRSIAPRTPMKIKALTIMTEHSVHSMWLRLVAHYFEWLAGVPEMRYLSDRDKVCIAVSQLCTVICYSVVYLNYQMDRKNEEGIFYFGSGFYWDPVRMTDQLMEEFCRELAFTANIVMPEVRKLRMTFEEFALSKLIVLFDCSSLPSLTPSGCEFIHSMCNKYRTILSQYIKNTIENSPENYNLNEEDMNELAVARTRAILEISTLVKKMARKDDEGLCFMIKNNYGQMRGTLQMQIHFESKKSKPCIC